GDVERLRGAERELLGKRNEIRGIAAEEAPVQAAIEAPGGARRRRHERADIREAHVGEVGRGELDERLDHPARLQRADGKNADAARIRASAAGSESQAARRTTYSCSASSGIACGSCTKVSTPNSCSSRMMSMTFELRMSGTSSLNVSPSTLTRAPLMLRPAWIICCTVLRAIWLPIESLMRRPARITSGW